jgi:GT2 family glycosyltransferase
VTPSDNHKEHHLANNTEGGILSGHLGVGVSVVVPSHNGGENLHRAVNSLLAGLPAHGEIVVVDDRSNDGSAEQLRDRHRRLTVLRPQRRLGVAGARNFGARHSRGDVIVFSDADIMAPQDWAAPLLYALTKPRVGAVGPVLSNMQEPQSKAYGLRFCDDATNVEWLHRKGSRPWPVPLLPGFFIAMRRKVFAGIGGFDVGMIIYGMDDNELSLRLWTFGYNCLIVPTVDVAHYDCSNNPPSYHANWERGLHNVLRLGILHFGRRRLRRLIECYADDSSFPSALAKVCTSDAWDRRKEIHAARIHDDDWFFSRVNTV